MCLGHLAGRLAPQWPWEPARAGLQLGGRDPAPGPQAFPGEGRSFGPNGHKTVKQSFIELIQHVLGAPGWSLGPPVIMGARQSRAAVEGRGLAPRPQAFPRGRP